jgi:2-amino-4-hydroxy-6-hydroxymethyldihydropteridine diphosphokinase
MVIANIGLGSNLGDTAQNLRDAVKNLEDLGTVLAKSRLYHSKPWGVLDQPDFCNAVLQLETELPPRGLLIALKNLEMQMGREESRRWGPRLIDLDILTYGDQKVNDTDLIIPHLHMNDRAFVLKPLCDIDSSYSAALKALPRESQDEVQLLDLAW